MFHELKAVFLGNHRCAGVKALKADNAVLAAEFFAAPFDKVRHFQRFQNLFISLLLHCFFYFFRCHAQLKAGNVKIGGVGFAV